MEYLTTDFKISCPDELIQTARDLLADAVAEAGYESFEDTENGLKGYVQKKLLNKDTLENAIKNFPLENTTISYTTTEAENKDWNETWEEEGFEPINIDDKLIIEDANHKAQDSTEGHCSNEVRGKVKFNAQKIKIEAKLAFGTGTHQTTQMIVSTLLNMELKGKRILDCGCGTGILGIAASKLGAKEVVSYDIDEWSVENTKHNADINDVHNINVYLGDASVISTFKDNFDIVLANINRNILLHDMPAMISVMSDDAALILSGFYKDDIPMLQDKARELGLTLKNQKSKGDWQMLEFSK